MPIFSSVLTGATCERYLSYVLYLLKGKQKTHVEPLSSFLGLSPQVCEEAGWKSMLGNLMGNKIRTQEIYSSFKTSLTSAPLPFYSLQVNEDAICRLSVLGSMGMLRALDGTRSLHSPGGSARGARNLGLAMRMHLPMRIGCASMRIDAHHPHIVQKMTSHFLPINCHFGSVFPNPWAQSPISWPI